MEYTFNGLIKVVKRENNSKREFLFLNLLQGKYVPANPKQINNLFTKLSKKIPIDYLNKKTTIIGFAETATAIGAIIAESFKENGFYLTTTREEMEKENLIVSFEEEHSHAPNHFLYCRQRQKLKDSEVILFVDDELTTGKTILNFIKSLKQNQAVNSNVKFIVLSIVNCMSEERKAIFFEEAIFFDSLIWEEKDWNNIIWKGTTILNKNKQVKSEFYEEKIIEGKIEIREGANIVEYQKACQDFCKKGLQLYPIEKKKKETLILGTEECMYPAIKLASYFQEYYKKQQFWVYATSRSPILPLSQIDYPIQNRSALRSFYHKDREIFLYNLRKYDQVIIVTDSEKIEKEVIEETVGILNQFGNENIVILKWVK